MEVPIRVQISFGSDNRIARVNTEPCGTPSESATDPGRRGVLALAIVPAAWLLFPGAGWAAPAAVGNLPAISIPDKPSLPEFVRLSEILTGRSDLDPDMARRIYALIQLEPYGPQHVTRVYERIRVAAASDPDRARNTVLNPQAFDAGERWFVGHLLVTWYTGVYYHAVGNQRVGFEEALMHRALADMRNPPTVCRDQAGFWARRPDHVGPIE